MSISSEYRSIYNTKIRDLHIVVNEQGVSDHRGSIKSLWQEGIEVKDYVTQTNFNLFIPREFKTSTTNKGMFRGLHAEKFVPKLITCLSGSAKFIFVDIDPKSPTYKNEYCCTLESSMNMSIYLPAMVANGHTSITDNCSLLYILSEKYNINNQIALNPGFHRIYNSLNVAAQPETMSNRDWSAQGLDKYYDEQARANKV